MRFMRAMRPFDVVAPADGAWRLPRDCAAASAAAGMRQYLATCGGSAATIG
jgi:hypothetical protein